MKMQKELSEKEREQFERLMYAFQNDKVALVRVLQGGEQRAAVVWMEQDDDKVELYPLAMLLEDRHFDEITPPDEATVSEGE